MGASKRLFMEQREMDESSSPIIFNHYAELEWFYNNSNLVLNNSNGCCSHGQETNGGVQQQDNEQDNRQPDH
jgi:hypothetical protein